ncbi:MAG: hypothetical protein HC768_13100 [Acaryochloris sp. CRU_2_0]|nr:hypothetical protein [Acaryochloris sp. CRU_2_0]
MSNQTDALKKELARTRAKARIIEKLLECHCDIRDCGFSVSPQKAWKSPEGYPLAVSFEVIGGSEALVAVGAANFVVYGSDMESIREVALYYGKQKYGASRLQKERLEDQSQVGRVVETRHRGDVESDPVEVVGIYPTWLHGDESPCNETMYIGDKGRLLTLPELQAMPDWEWEECEDYGLSNAD